MGAACCGSDNTNESKNGRKQTKTDKGKRTANGRSEQADGDQEITDLAAVQGQTDAPRQAPVHPRGGGGGVGANGNKASRYESTKGQGEATDAFDDAPSYSPAENETSRRPHPTFAIPHGATDNNNNGMNRTTSLKSSVAGGGGASASSGHLMGHEKMVGKNDSSDVTVSNATSTQRPMASMLPNPQLSVAALQNNTSNNNSTGPASASNFNASNVRSPPLHLFAEDGAPAFEHLRSEIGHQLTTTTKIADTTPNRNGDIVLTFADDDDDDVPSPNTAQIAEQQLDLFNAGYTTEESPLRGIDEVDSSQQPHTKDNKLANLLRGPGHAQQQEPNDSRRGSATPFHAATGNNSSHGEGGTSKRLATDVEVSTATSVASNAFESGVLKGSSSDTKAQNFVAYTQPSIIGDKTTRPHPSEKPSNGLAAPILSISEDGKTVMFVNNLGSAAAVDSREESPTRVVGGYANQHSWSSSKPLDASAEVEIILEAANTTIDDDNYLDGGVHRIQNTILLTPMDKNNQSQDDSTSEAMALATARAILPAGVPQRPVLPAGKQPAPPRDSFNTSADDEGEEGFKQPVLATVILKPATNAFSKPTVEQIMDEVEGFGAGPRGGHVSLMGPPPPPGAANQGRAPVSLMGPPPPPPPTVGSSSLLTNGVGNTNRHAHTSNMAQPIKLSTLTSGGMETPVFKKGDEEKVLSKDWFNAQKVDPPRVSWSQTKTGIKIEIEPANESCGWNFDEKSGRVIEYNYDDGDFRIRALMPLWESVKNPNFELKITVSGGDEENAVATQSRSCESVLVFTAEKLPAPRGKDSDSDEDDDEGGEDEVIAKHPPRFWTQLFDCSRKTYIGLEWVHNTDDEREELKKKNSGGQYQYQGLARPGAEEQFASYNFGGGGGGGGDFSDADD